jgi:hypothetical protein
MEALHGQALVDEPNGSRRLPPVPAPSYLAQPEMRSFIQAALDLGWTLHGYEADVARAPSDWDPLGITFGDGH